MQQLNKYLHAVFIVQMNAGGEKDQSCPDQRWKGQLSSRKSKVEGLFLLSY